MKKIFSFRLAAIVIGDNQTRLHTIATERRALVNIQNMSQRRDNEGNVNGVKKNLLWVQTRLDYLLDNGFMLGADGIHR